MRKLLVAGALVAVALIVLVFVIITGGGGTEPHAGGAAAAAPGPSAAADSPHAAPTAAPHLASEPPAVASDDGTREYTVNGVHVRDHRSGNPSPIAVTPQHPEPNLRRLPIPLVSAISNQVKQAMSTCAQGLPPAAFGKRPRLQGQLTVAIKDHQLSVTKLAVQLQDVEDPVAQLQSCIEHESVGLSTPAADEQDLDAYTIRISYAVR